MYLVHNNKSVRRAIKIAWTLAAVDAMEIWISRHSTSRVTLVVHIRVLGLNGTVSLATPGVYLEVHIYVVITAVFLQTNIIKCRPIPAARDVFCRHLSPLAGIRILVVFFSELFFLFRDGNSLTTTKLNVHVFIFFKIIFF